MLDWIIEGLRWLIWGLTSACLKLMDICYQLVIDIASADFLSDANVWKWYAVFMGFLGVLIIMRSVSMYIKFALDEEFRDKLNATHIFNKMIMIVMVMTFLPPALSFVSAASVYGIENISVILGSQSNELPSTFIVTSFMNTNNGEYTADGKWVDGNRITYKLDDIKINEEGTGETKYKFFDEIGDLFILTFIGIAAAVMLIINAIQIGKRSYALVMKVIIAPIPISSLIVPGDETFAMWRKMIASDYLLNFIQTLMLMVVMILSGSKILTQFSVWVQIISFLSGLLLLLTGIPELSKILGGDTSGGGILQQAAAFRQATRGIGHGLGNAMGKIAGTANTGLAYAGYGAGRMLGGESIKSMNEQSQQSGGDGGFMGGSEKSDKAPISPSSESFNKEPTKRQAQAAKKMGINTDNMNRGQVSLAMEKKGAEASYFGEHGNRQGPEIGEGDKSTSTNTGGVHVSRENTRARKASDFAHSKTGASGFSARLAKNASSHMYQSSMKRVQKSKAYRTGSQIKGMGARTPALEPGGSEE